MENNEQSHIEYRKKPVNIVTDDDILFRQEYEYKCLEPQQKNYKNVFFNTQGYVYDNFKPVVEELSIRQEVETSFVKNYIKCKLFKKRTIREPVFFIHDLWNEGYFHWNMEALFRLFYFHKTIFEKNKNFKLIIPDFYLEVQYIKDSLLYFGFNESNCISVRDNTIYFCEDIFYCPPIAITGNYHSPIMNELVRFLKLNADTKVKTPQRLIYVSRKNAPKRKVSNENEVIELVKKYGFESIETDSLSYAEQIQLFNDAKWFISIHGAALTNMFFMNPETNVLEIREENDNTNNCYFSLASAMRLNYFYIKGKIVERIDYHVPDLSIDICELDRILSIYL